MNILVLVHSPFRMWTIPDAQVGILRQAFPEHEFLHAHDDVEGTRLAASADVAFTGQLTPEQLDAAPRLRWIHSPSAGIAGMLFPAMLARDIVITNSRGLSAQTIAEHVLAVTLALFRRLPLAFARQADREWAQDEIGGEGNRTIAGSHVVIVGMGGIGTATAARMHALGARVTGVRRRVDADLPPGVSAIRRPEELREVLADADVVVIAAPQTRETRGLIGAPELAAMKPDAVLVNVSRGGLVDEDALSRALREHRLAGAALDVFRNEPLAADSPLWDLPNLLVTPHTSGYRRDHWQAVVALFADNLRRFERGEELLNLVDTKRGY